ncbi:SCO3242 family prenyltransferase [Streptomyces sp. NPDC048338]|uniref:SCO3242 family prenyltransferase n=1 Tax=Streptomyces sp. NPDC048338 TaxID=3365536 RepID=UPI00371CE5F6
MSTSDTGPAHDTDRAPGARRPRASAEPDTSDARDTSTEAVAHIAHVARDTSDAHDNSGEGSTRSAGPRPGAGVGTVCAAWAELLRVSALFTVPGDALAGAAAAGMRPNRRTLLAAGASLCLYEAGMTLNDWADRDEDARDRPHRPLPSGRITPRAALTASVALTAAGLGLAARAGRPSLVVATTLAATVWSYDLRLKHTPAGPAAMAAARGLDLLLGATATGPLSPRPLPSAALPSAALLAAHTWAVTSVSRHETRGGSGRAPLLALAATLAVAATAARPRPSVRRPPPPSIPGRPVAAPLGVTAGRLLTAAVAAGYARTPAAPYLHAALHPSPPLVQRSVGAGIRALIPLQATLALRAGAPGTGLALLALAPLARALARKVSPT